MKTGRLDAYAHVLLLAPAVAVLFAVVAVPAALSVADSVRGEILALPARGAPFVGMDNYRALFASAVFRRSLSTTLLFVVGSVVAEMALGIGLAFALDGVARGRGLARALVLVPWAIPTAVAAQMGRFLWNDRYGPLAFYLTGGSAPLASAWGALAVLIATDVWKTTPFVALIALAGLQGIPQGVLEAARVDGARPWLRFRRVVLPLLRPALIAALLFRLIDAFRVFDLVFVITQGGPADGTDTLQYLGYRRSFAEGMVGAGSAISTVVFAITLAATLVYLRFGAADLWKKEA